MKLSHIVLVEPPQFFLDEWLEFCNAVSCRVSLISSNVAGTKRVVNLGLDINAEFEEVVSQLKFENVTAVLAMSDKYLVAAENLANRLGVSLNSTEIIELTRSKELSKQTWISAGVPTPKLLSPKDLSADSVYFPCIVKPSNGYSSIGVKLVSNMQELLDQYRRIELINRTVFYSKIGGCADILVEEYIDGPEFAVDTFWFEGEALCHFILCRNDMKGPFFNDSLYYFDPCMTQDVINKIELGVTEGLKSIGVTSGISHTELRLNNGIPYLIETGLRPAGGGMFNSLYKTAYGVNPLYLLFLLCQGSSLETIQSYIRSNSRLSKHKVFAYLVPYEGKGRIVSINGEDIVKQRSDVINLMLFKKKGDYLYEFSSSLDYFCCVIGQDSDEIEMELMIDQFNATIQPTFEGIQTIS